MMSVLIADDEPMVCTLISHLIDWEGLEMNPAGIAHNGLQALSMVEEFHPDVIITDIRMPGIDGLELTRKIRKSNPEISVIIISGFREFEFARQAIQFGVEDYLLKPINRDELNHILLRIRKKREERMELQRRNEAHSRQLIQLQNDVRREWLRDVILRSSREGGHLAVSEPFTQRRMRLWIFRLQKGICDKNGTPEDPTIIEHAMDHFGETFRDYMNDYIAAREGAFGYFLQSSSELQDGSWRKEESIRSFLDIWRQKNPGYPIIAASGGIFSSMSEFRSAKRQAEEMLLRSAWDWMGEYRSWMSALEIPEGVVSESDLERIRERTGLLDLEGLRKAVREICVREGGCELPLTERMNLCLEEIRKAVVDMGTDNIENGGSGLEPDDGFTPEKLAASRQEYRELCDRRVVRLIETGIHSRQIQMNLPVRTIRQYMKLHYAESLSLEDMAELVHMTPTYISGLFKKETGRTFSADLLEIRMAEAKKLLRDPAKNITEIAGAVGYTDSRYFSKMFTRTVGITPKEYRRLHG